MTRSINKQTRVYAFYDFFYLLQVCPSIKIVARLAEWSKALDICSDTRESAWVRTPHLAKFFWLLLIVRTVIFRLLKVIRMHNLLADLLKYLVLYASICRNLKIHYNIRFLNRQQLSWWKESCYKAQ